MSSALEKKVDTSVCFSLQNCSKIKLRLSLGRSLHFQRSVRTKVVTKSKISYNTLDASSKFYSEREYDEDGKLVAEPDATGKHKTSYRYAAGDGKLLGESLPNGSEFAYTTLDKLSRYVYTMDSNDADTNGNILCRKEYAFTLTNKLDELDCTDFVYTYDGDKLLSYNGESCKY